MAIDRSRVGAVCLGLCAAVVSRRRHGAGDGRAPYAGPVAVLLDGRCFSATDVFLGAIERLPNVTLVGTASGGGSVRSEGAEIVGPPALRLRLASIASFRPDGRAYDGAGIEPDAGVWPAEGDAEFDAAVGVVSASRR